MFKEATICQQAVNGFLLEEVLKLVPNCLKSCASKKKMFFVVNFVRQTPCASSSIPWKQTFVFDIP